jgi:hypothetical protein
MTASPHRAARGLTAITAALVLVATLGAGVSPADAQTTTTTTAAPVAPATTPEAPTTATVVASPSTGLDPSYANNLTVSGTGFQDIVGGFSGIYVLFGWVDANWRPSTGGVSGVDYKYVEDEQTKNNHGYIKFVSYSKGTTLSAANGGIITPAGTWKTTLVVPGATFPASGENGQITQVNCLQVQCGVITIGAHGVIDNVNETFTPVTFAATSAQATPTTVAPTTTVAPSPTAKTHPAKTHPKKKGHPRKKGGPKNAHPKKKGHSKKAKAK